MSYDFQNSGEVECLDMDRQNTRGNEENCLKRVSSEDIHDDDSGDDDAIAVVTSDEESLDNDSFDAKEEEVESRYLKLHPPRKRRRSKSPHSERSFTEPRNEDNSKSDSHFVPLKKLGPAMWYVTCRITGNLIHMSRYYTPKILLALKPPKFDDCESDDDYDFLSLRSESEKQDTEDDGPTSSRYMNLE